MSDELDPNALPEDPYLSATEVAERYAHLAGQLAELRRKSSAAVNSLTEERESAVDHVDFAQAESERDFAARLAGRDERLVRKIRQSFERMAAGEYGECEACGDEIGYRRLLARPVATVCIDCKTEHELRERILKYA